MVNAHSADGILHLDWCRPLADVPKVAEESRLCKNSQRARLAGVGETRAAAIPQVRMAAISGPVPRICITRFML